MLVGIGAHVCDTAAAYMFATFTVAYATDELDMSRSVVLGAVVTYGLLVIALQPLFGALSDRIGRRPLNLFGVIFTGLWAFPFFALVQTGEPVLVWIALIVGGDRRLGADDRRPARVLRRAVRRPRALHGLRHLA